MIPRHYRRSTQLGQLRRVRLFAPPQPIWKRPDAWAVFVAVLALIVSAFSWFTTDQQLKLTKGQVRSYVQLIDAELTEPIATSSYFRLNLKLKNVGQTAAIAVQGEMFYELGFPGSSEYGGSGTKKDLQNFGPGVERVVQLTAPARNHHMWPPAQFKYPPTLYFFGSIWSTDDTTKERRREDWCFFLKLRRDGDMQSKTVEPCDVLTYRPNIPT